VAVKMAIIMDCPDTTLQISEMFKECRSKDVNMIMITECDLPTKDLEDSLQLNEFKARSMDGITIGMDSQLAELERMQGIPNPTGVGVETLTISGKVVMISNANVDIPEEEVSSNLPPVATDSNNTNESLNLEYL
jgi:hypothetical protein